MNTFHKPNACWQRSKEEGTKIKTVRTLSSYCLAANNILVVQIGTMGFQNTESGVYLRFSLWAPVTDLFATLLSPLEEESELIMPSTQENTGKCLGIPRSQLPSAWYGNCHQGDHINLSHMFASKGRHPCTWHFTCWKYFFLITPKPHQCSTLAPDMLWCVLAQRSRLWKIKRSSI